MTNKTPAQEALEDFNQWCTACDATTIVTIRRSLNILKAIESGEIDTPKCSCCFCMDAHKGLLAKLKEIGERKCE